MRRWVLRGGAEGGEKGREVCDLKHYISGPSFSIL